MKTKALNFLFSHHDVAEPVFHPSCYRFRCSSLWFTMRSEWQLKNPGGVGDCLNIREVKNWRREIATITFKGGAIVVTQKGKTFRAFRRGAESKITVAADGSLMRNRYRILINDTIEIRTGQEKGFFLLNPGVDFTLTNGDAILRGNLKSTEFPGSEIFGKLQSNRFSTVDLRKPSLVREHFGNDENCALATALLLWIVRDHFGG